MVRIILFVVMVLVGGGAGLGAGLFLRPAPEVAKEGDHGDAEDHASEEDHGEDDGKEDDDHGEDDHGDEDHGEPGESTSDIVKLQNQFIVPVLDDKRVKAMVVLSMSLETTAGSQAYAFEQEPKIRDAMLQVLFDHANAGGFSDNFTGGDRLERLRELLRSAILPILGDRILKVLITDIARQDM